MKVSLASRVGATTLTVKISDRMPQGVVYTTFHHPVTGANVITTENSDWATNCPEYKVTAVQVTVSNAPVRMAGRVGGARGREQAHRRRKRDWSRPSNLTGHRFGASRRNERHAESGVATGCRGRALLASGGRYGDRRRRHAVGDVATAGRDAGRSADQLRALHGDDGDAGRFARFCDRLSCRRRRSSKIRATFRACSSCRSKAAWPSTLPFPRALLKSHGWHGAPSRGARVAGFAASRISRPPSGRCRRSRGPGHRLRRPSGARLHDLADQQPMNRLNRSVHGAAWVSRDGEILLVREDVGRHNALDKLIGALHFRSLSTAKAASC